MKKRITGCALCAVFVSLFLASCMSIPLTTMLKLRGFSADDFALLDPNEVMLKVLLPEPLEVNPEKTKFEIAFFFDNQDTKKYTFPLEQVGVERETRGWFRKTQWRYFVLQITPAGKQIFLRLQQELNQNMETKTSAKLSAATYFKELPPEQMPETAVMSLLLRLNEKDGFFTLIDEAEIDFRKIKETE